MSMFPIPDELLPDAKKLEEMSKELSALMPKEFTGAVNLMVHPVAGVAAVSALGLGAASHAFGIWMGAVAGAAEMSQRMFTPFFDEAKLDDFRDRTNTPVKRARAAADTLIADAQTVARETAKVVAKAVEPVIKAKPAPVEKPKAEIVKKAVNQVPEAFEKANEKLVTPAAVETAADLMPEDFRQPKAIAKPKKPDDLKLISGVGPKLETVLNGLGVWTYAQIAELGREEIAWLEDYFGFKGRIGRDGWIGQALKLAEGRES
ncbi:NADH-ubiquinone dehydrogenase [Mesorhizobium sp. ZC-5]|uniref:NADH-ubiquinone dehydrogenase n=1 Tax=Mesorhizobium sp. ZC-5 TaxID=2986066 RepID=UPI0021E8F3EA|nr:NADH-ubiquinone dehydrogenase [Mesorhizobium sp. ZC-5]MCV3240380.1 NADH-ubiquinone dehydrogenase [Mesorhizobium sp. ZC-5]